MNDLTILYVFAGVLIVGVSVILIFANRKKKEFFEIDNPDIKPGDYIVSNGKYDKENPNFKEYFKNGPLKVEEIEENCLAYTGGAFVWVDKKRRFGFYINGVKRVDP